MAEPKGIRLSEPVIQAYFADLKRYDLIEVLAEGVQKYWDSHSWEDTPEGQAWLQKVQEHQQQQVQAHLAWHSRLPSR